MFNELKSTLQASGCYNEAIEKAYFNKSSIEQGYKPAEFCCNGHDYKLKTIQQTRVASRLLFYCHFKIQRIKTIHKTKFNYKKNNDL